MKIITITLLIITGLHGSAQQLKSLRIGQKVPSEVLKEIGFDKRTKILVLDFWSTYCSICIAGFPKMAELKEKYEDSLQVILINTLENDKEIAERFSRINSNRVKGADVIIPKSLKSITGAKKFKYLFPHTTVPHHVWINEKGVIIGVTQGSNTNIYTVREVLRGNLSVLEIKNDSLLRVIKSKGYLRPTIENLEPLYYSSLTRYFGATGASTTIVNDSTGNNYRVLVMNSDPISLYRFAFSEASVRERIVYEMKDTRQFFESNEPSLKLTWKNRYLFTYEAKSRYGNLMTLKDRMKSDLNYFFASLFQIEALFQKQSYEKSLILIIKDSSVFREKVSQTLVRDNVDSVFTWIDIPFATAVIELQNRLEDMSIGRPLIDETGIRQNVNMRLTGDLRNLENVKQQLNTYGLDIIEGERQVDVLVIREKK